MLQNVTLNTHKIKDNDQHIINIRNSADNMHLATNADGNVVKHRLCQTLLQRAVDVLFGQTCAQQANAAVDVEADTAWRYNGLGV